MSESLRDIEVYSAYLRWVDPPIEARRGQRISSPWLTKWKRRRRHRDARHTPLVACEWCGGENKLDRHHDWRGAERVKPVVLCRPCHDSADGRRAFVCAGCCWKASTLADYRAHVERCQKIPRSVIWVAGRIVSGW